jgi:hypothetical protein
VSALARPKGQDQEQQQQQQQQQQPNLTIFVTNSMKIGGLLTCDPLIERF